MKITDKYLTEIGCKKINNEYILRLGATTMELRLYSDKCYCQLPGLYIGEITADRLKALYFGFTGNNLTIHI